ncbi:MAG: carbohydrate ABC transporter permease, partial [Firmicutes bacterium]|nr:carbohydrate ABC transporter permease [Bacillota bacterium]
MKIKKSKGNIIFDICNCVFMVILIILTLYPIWYVLIASLSDGSKFLQHTGIMLKPAGFSIASYKLMLKNPMILIGYKNTLLILIVGLTGNILLTSLLAYGLSRKDLYWGNIIFKLIVFTMYFSGGLIPFYLTVSKMYHLDNSYLAIILPALINTYNMIIMRTAFMSIPESLTEAATIDGASHWRILFNIVFPLSMPTIAVITLYYSVEHWNSWFNASIFLHDRNKFPLQLVLREILIINDTTTMVSGTSSNSSDAMSIGETVKYAVIVTATFPILCMYPFIQKYFVNGIMIGA